MISISIGDEENIEKFNRRLVKVSKQHNEECKELLKYMGIPFINVSCQYLKPVTQFCVYYQWNCKRKYEPGGNY